MLQVVCKVQGQISIRLEERETPLLLTLIIQRITGQEYACNQEDYRGSIGVLSVEVTGYKEACEHLVFPKAHYRSHFKPHPEVTGFGPLGSLE
jgi:hypothetical protein